MNVQSIMVKEMNNEYSLLMSVYYKERPEYLKRSVESVMEQTIVPSDFVIVCDGPLTEELDSVLKDLEQRFPVIHLIRLEKNSGLGIALNNGLEHVKYSIVMRMDSDDVCFKDRAEKELPLMEEYDLVGGWITEFENEEDNLIGTRKVPEHYKQIRKFAKSRSPFNHPSVMFKKEIVEKAGGYQHLLYLEDYYLWVRILKLTDKVYNIQEPLVNMRSGIAMRTRRGGKEYKKSLKTIRKFLLKSKMITIFGYLYLSIAHGVFLSLPLKTKEKLYKRVLRK